jgi:hypothetical protein
MNISGGRVFLAPLPFRDFFAVNDHIARRFDADANLRAIHCHDGDFDIIANS